MTVAPGPALEELMTVDELATAAGLTVRNTRYYSGLGLLPPPVRRGRMAYYDRMHLAHLERRSPRSSSRILGLPRGVLDGLVLRGLRVAEHLLEDGDLLRALALHGEVPVDLLLERGDLARELLRVAHPRILRRVQLLLEVLHLHETLLRPLLSRRELQPEERCRAAVYRRRWLGIKETGRIVNGRRGRDIGKEDL